MDHRIRLIGRDNGNGLSRDLHLLARTLRAPSVALETVGFGGVKAANWTREAGLWARSAAMGKVAVQIFPERVYPRCLPLAERNLLLPNPEWFLPKWQRYLPRFDLVLCKTRHAEAIFSQLGCATRRIGFTSEDRFEPRIASEHAFLHVAGQSTAKGTEVLLETWKRQPRWPLLTVVQHPKTARTVVEADNIRHIVGYLDDTELRLLQNRHQFHICPSEVEGFGHYLMEALSVGAVVLTTDAAPMNELVTPARGILIPAKVARRQCLAERYRIEPDSIVNAVEQALALTTEQRWKLSRAARNFFQDNDRLFRTRLRDAVLADNVPFADTVARIPPHGDAAARP